MKRFRSRHPIYKNIEATKKFVYQHSSVFALLCLIIGGVVLGISVFRALNEEHRAFVSELLYKSPQSIDWQNASTAIIGSCIRHSLILVFLFLFGLTAFGCPLILCTVLLFGFRVGVIISVSYLAYGFWNTALTVYLPVLIAGIATLLAVRRSLHMSCVYSRQLLPSGAHCGSLWSEFRRYLVSFTLCFGLVLAASITEILLQVLKSSM